MTDSFLDENFRKDPSGCSAEGLPAEGAYGSSTHPNQVSRENSRLNPDTDTVGSSGSQGSEGTLPEALEALAQEVVRACPPGSEAGAEAGGPPGVEAGPADSLGEPTAAQSSEATWWGETLEATGPWKAASSAWANFLVWTFTLLLLGTAAFSLVIAWEWFLRQELGPGGLGGLGGDSGEDDSEAGLASAGMAPAETARETTSGVDRRPRVKDPAQPAKSWEERLQKAAEILGLPPELPTTAEACNREAWLVVERLVAELPQRPEALALAAFFHNRQSRFQEAEAYWHKALELNVNFAPAYSGLGWLAARRGELDRAVEYLRKAIALDPYAGHSHSLLVDVLLRQSKPEQAVVAARQYVAVFPQAGDSNYWLGQALLELGQIEEAKKAYLAAIRYDLEYTAAYHSLSLVCVRLGEREEARKWREKFQVLKEKDMEKDRRRTREFHDLSVQQRFAAQYHLAAGNVHSNFGDPQKAEAHWIRGAAVHPGSTDCRLALAEYYEKNQQLPEAHEQWVAIAVHSTAGAPHWFRKAEVEKRLGMFAEAEKSYRKAAELAPEAPEPLSALVDLALSYGHKLADLRDLAERAVTVAPTAQNYFALSAVRESQGDLPGALQALEAALRQQPTHPLLRVAYERLKIQKPGEAPPTNP
jgi:tetratricopeptide (TPR) repeat protein